MPLRIQQGIHAVDGRVDDVAHFDYGVQRKAIKLRKFGKQINRIKGRSEYGHHQSSHNTSYHRIFLVLPEQVNDRSGKQEGAANNKVCQISYEGGGGSFE